MKNLESPDGRFLITIDAWEARMSLWIESPTISERDSGEKLLAFQDSNWSMDSSEWRGESVVEMMLRKYPGNHTPAQVRATIDCGARTAEVDGKRVESLAEVERALDEVLTWRYATVPPIKESGGLVGLLRRLFGR